MPRLVAAGHEVHAMTRSESKQGMLFDLGAVPVVADALNAEQVAEAVGRAKPDVIVHELTSIGALDMRHFDRDFALTNRLRTEGTDHLLSAGQAVGVRRFVAQSYVASYARTGGAVKREEDPFDPTPAKEMRETDARQRLLAVWSLGIAGSAITSVSSVVNPDKLAHLGPVGDFGSVLASRSDGDVV